MREHSFWFYWFVLFELILARYVLIGGGAYWCFYRASRKFSAARSLRHKPLNDRAIYHDIKLSVLAAVVFALCAALVLTGHDLGWTLLYGDWQQYGGLWYVAVSFGAVLLLQDAFFYWLHRLLHHPLCFKWMHYGHHRSGDPTPWTSFAFDLPEALIQALFFVGIVFVVPLHFVTLILALLTMTVWAVWNHLGFELCPASFSRHWLGQWLIGPTHHAMHHRRYRVHYGLYFTIWDQLCGTEDPQYKELFDRALSA